MIADLISAKFINQKSEIRNQDDQIRCRAQAGRIFDG